MEAPESWTLALIIIMSNNHTNTINNATYDPSDNSLDAHLNTLLSNNSSDDSNGTDDLMEILARLESADGIATDVEGKLDQLLGTLDNLLTSLETRNEDTPLEDERRVTVEAEQVTVIATESNPSESALGR